jgi:hypothetical protein
MQLVLGNFAKLLGLKNVEIFPKQKKLKNGRGGNCLTMPYVGTTFDGKMRDQVGINKSGGGMTPGQFLNCAEARRVAPDKFAELLAQATQKSKSDGSGGEFDHAEAAAKAERQLANYAEKIGAMENGRGRNAYFNKAAYVMGRYIGAGVIDEDQVKTKLRAAAVANADGMDMAKVDDMLRRSIEKGKLNPFPPEELASREYVSRPDGLWWVKPEGGLVKLSNFSAAVVEETILDDGSEEEQRIFGIESSLGTVSVPAGNFDSLRWVTSKWGADACVSPGHGTGQRFLDAIKKLGAGERVKRRVFAHTGWRKVEGKLKYLHAGCAGDVEVKLDGALGHFILPAVTEVKTAMRASLRMLDLAPPHVAYPLFGAAYHAPLGEWAPITAALFLHGKTGVRKTALAMIGQAHFAPGLDAPPANWEATANALERTAFLAKDVAVVLDDFVHKDGASAHDKAKLYYAARGRNGTAAPCW